MTNLYAWSRTTTSSEPSVVYTLSTSPEVSTYPYDATGTQYSIMFLKISEVATDLSYIKTGNDIKGYIYNRDSSKDILDTKYIETITDFDGVTYTIRDKNAGTITGITMNGASKGTSGVVDLGTVITDVSGKQDKLAAIGSASVPVYVSSAGTLSTCNTIPTTTSSVASGSTAALTSGGAYTALSGKQATLVSGTNIKTINGSSILGSGNIEVGGSITVDNKTISENSSEELQAIGVIDSSDSTTALKTWTGTKAEYDAITTKDSNTLYTVTDDLVSVTNSVYLKTTYVNGTSGYRIWSDGYCEQWGIISATSSGTLTFLKVFADLNYNIIMHSVSSYNREVTGSGLFNPTSRTASSCTYYADGNIPTTMWRACGYLAEGEY